MNHAPDESFAYDRMPYPGIADPEAHPRQLEALATFFGMQPAPLAEARVLEIGCASGKHLLPIALDYPTAQFVGADLSGEQIGRATALAKQLEITNVELRHNNLAEIDESWGKFDYILCPGVFSWVQPELQNRILEICSRNLAPQGVAVVSYNTYPGWHFFRAARDAMRYHALQFEEPAQQVAEARGALQFFVENCPNTTMHGRLYEDRARFLNRSTDSYLYHDYLVNDNWPLYFNEFVRRSAASGLQFLSETNYAQMTSAFFPPKARKELSKLTLLHREQILDFLRNQSYRKTIVCHEQIALDRRVDVEAFGNFKLTLAEIPQPSEFDVQSGEGVTFSFRLGSFRTGNPFGKAALRCLIDRFPQAISLEELLAAALDLLPADKQPQAVDGKSPREILALSMVATMNAGLLQAYRHPPLVATNISEHPRASSLARWEADQSNAVTNQRHEVIKLDPFSQKLLRLLDGQRDSESLARSLAESAEASATAESTIARVELGSSSDLTLPAFRHDVQKTLAGLYRHSLLVS